MRLLLIQAAAVTLAAAAATAQTTSTRRGYIRAFGEASIAVRPDMARLTVSVVTQAATAQEASALNATRATAVFDALRQAIGSTGEIRTVSYTVSPNYNYPRDGGTPVLTGFTATNSVEVTTGDLNITGKVIDTAISAGATRVDNLTLTVKDEEPVRAQALRAAGQKARTRADAIALGLGVKVGALVSAEEGFVYRVVAADDARVAPPAASAPIEAGTLQIRATITVEYETVP